MDTFYIERDGKRIELTEKELKEAQREQDRKDRDERVLRDFAQLCTGSHKWAGEGYRTICETIALLLRKAGL